MPLPLPPPGQLIPEQPKRRPSGRWYALPVLLALAAAAVFVTGLVLFVTSVTDGFDEVSNNATVTITDDAPDLYAPVPTPVVGCRLVAADGARIELDSVVGSVHVDINGTDYYKIASVPDDVAPGDYTLRCPGAGPNLWTGPEVDLGMAFTGVALILIVPAMLGLAAVASLVVIVVKRNS